MSPAARMDRPQTGIPTAPGFDQTLALLREGYLFIGRRCDELGSDLFRTRLMLSPAICMRGPAAAEQFYREGRFTRRGALPRTTVALLQDWGSVQTLEDAEHRHRKRMFMDMMDNAGLSRAADIFRDEWQSAAGKWAGKRIVLHDAVLPLLTRTALRWCGIPPEQADPEKRATALAAMIENAGGGGLSYFRARLLRARSEAWAQSLIKAIREGLLLVQRDCPAERIALHRDLAGELLPKEIAAVELINLLRPIVAIGRFITFAGHAMHVHMREARQLPRQPSQEDVNCFVQEVRRFYPFFPFVSGRVREPFTWRGHRFSRGDWVVLDLYGTNHHPDAWPDPEAFRPQRFRDWKGNAYAFVAQGGGSFVKGHRCAGEWLTIALTGKAVRCLLAMDYAVPKQDLSIPMNKLPTRPESGFVMEVAP